MPPLRSPTPHSPGALACAHLVARLCHVGACIDEEGRQHLRQQAAPFGTATRHVVWRRTRCATRCTVRGALQRMPRSMECSMRCSATQEPRSSMGRSVQCTASQASAWCGSAANDSKARDTRRSSAGGGTGTADAPGKPGTLRATNVPRGWVAGSRTRPLGAARLTTHSGVADTP